MGRFKNGSNDFHYNKGSERKMDNYYDTIKILSVHNANDYRPKEVTLENMDIKILKSLIH